MARREELKVDLTANDQASAKIDEVAGKLEGLSGSAQVEITATDEATEVVENVAEEVEGLDGEAAEVELAAEDEASEVVEEVAGAVETLDGETATPTLDADDQASGDIEGVSGALSDLDGESASPTVDIEDDATSDIEDVTGALEDLDGQTATASIGLEGAEEAETATGGIGENLSAITGGQGLAALSAAGMLAIGQRAADAVLDVKGLADATGGSLDQTSRLKEVWDLAGGSVDTLERNIIRSNDKLRESPELAAALGLKIDENMTPMEVFIGAVEALNSGLLTDAERLDLAMEVFGSRGVLMLNDLETRVGDIGDGMAAIGEGEIITQADVDAALELSQKWDAVEDSMGEIARQLLPGIAGGVSAVADILESQLMQKLLEVTEQWGILEAAAGGPTVDGGDLVGSAAQIQVATDRLKEMTQWSDTATGAWADYADEARLSGGASEDAADATDEAAEAALRAAEAVKEHEDALRADIDAIEESIDLLTEQAGGFRDAADAQLEVEDANRGMTDATNAYAAAVAESGEDSQEAAEALRGVRDQAIRVADAQVDLARAQAEARGTTLSEVQALDVMNGSLLGQALTMNGPARDAILQRIADVNAIPPEVMTKIAAAIARGDLAEAQRLLDEASAPRDALVQAQADRQALLGAEAKLNFLARNRDAFVFVRPVGNAGNFGAATGDPFTNRGRTLVGEDGPEFVDMPAGARVTNAGQTAEMMRNGSSGGGTVNNYVTQNFPAGVRSRDVRRADRRYERLQAS